jgi:PhzF family phenazine biosynthesis protein
MRVPLFHVDAFTGRVFSGNPAAVCPLKSWLDDATLQAIATENNLSETAFFVPGREHYALRWFTPVQEVDLCGHATLASAWVIFNFLDRQTALAVFESRSGTLRVARADDLLVLDFPSRPPERCEAPALVEALGSPPREVWAAARDYMTVYETEEEVRGLRPEMQRLRALDRLGVIATAPGRTSDFVSRFFAPKAGVDEDPVTGSAHCTLTPYWAERLGTRCRSRGGAASCSACRAAIAWPSPVAP